MVSRISPAWQKPEIDIKRLHKDHKVLIAVLLVGLLNGLIFVLLMTPWQNFDEPKHFEYAWLIANRGKLPKMGDYDQEMRRQSAVSMLEHHFFKGMDFLPDLEATNQPITRLSMGELPPFLLSRLWFKKMVYEPG